MHKKSISIIAGALISISPAVLSIAHAQSAAMTRPVAAVSSAALPGAIEGVSVAEVVGTIQSVNRDTREVTIADKQGGKARFTVGPEAKNFAQLNVGDEIRVRMTRDVVVSVSKGGGLRSVVETEAAGRAPAGAKPAAGIARQLTIVADITKVDPASGIVQLKGPQGNLLDVEVRDRTKLAKVKAGDQVTLAYTEAVTVAVTPMR
jgi:Cu/Ag efflux protein CusF